MFGSVSRGCVPQYLYIGSGWIECLHAPDQFISLTQRGMPKSRHIPIQFNHYASLDQAFHNGRQGNNTSPRKWLNKEIDGRQTSKPCPNMGNEPCFSAGISEGAALRDLGYVDRWNR